MKAAGDIVEREKLPGRWQERLRLANGRELWLRPIRPEDAAPIDAGFALLRPEEIRQRYLHPVKALTPDYLDQLTHPDPAREFVLVAAEPYPPGEALVGAVARLAIDDDRRGAEFAILVSHYLAGYGLGRLMLSKLVHYARLRKLERLYGDVSEDNVAMLALAERLGFHRMHPQDSGGITRVVLDLRPGSTDAAA